jgi:hypothetical protein
VSSAALSSPRGIPTRSEIENWDTSNLENAASTGRQSAAESEEVFDQHRQNVVAPGGTNWEGDAKDAALDRVTADLGVVRSQGGVLRIAANIAQNGSDDIRAAQRKALEAIAEAEADGFRVGGDLSVTDTRRVDISTWATRQAAAAEHAENTRWNAEQLAKADALVGQRLQAKATELEAIRFDGEGEKTVQAVDFKQAPPPSPYPINDIIADATDLDGNHVVLRRGYYDASTGKGFGWDKAYWRHGVVNPNVFKDLISHSRPISNQGGTVVYEVPINRVHCSQGPFGFVDCEDTGESVTMRIVANINEGNPDVPGGGQNGVITMFPVKGGSGAVEIAPDWTWTPPWVNNNVPIN